LPEPIGPSDAPFVGEFLDKIDWWKNTDNLTKESISINIVVRFPKNYITDLYHKDFRTGK
ncbi:MAG: hypothetical protein Q8S22_02880, partial [Eubacteriales bacterium]|nr:hypothetical protein [Eubacteriales bacterium]